MSRGILRKRIVDLGCGPGLYANPLAAHGARVHGVDLSALAVQEVQRRTRSDRTSFEVGDYLTATLPDHDLAVLIHLDYCALSPAGRRRLLERVGDRMAADGRLLVDLHSEHR